MMAMHAIISVPTFELDAADVEILPSESAAAKTTPSSDSKIPGTRNSQRGEKSSMNRRCRQPSRHGFKCGGRERPSGCSVTGTSAIFNCLKRGLDDHFRGELHAGGLQIHLLERGLA